MRQLNSPQPFLDAMKTPAVYDSAFSRWDAIADNVAITTPAKRRAKGDKVTVLFPLVKAIVSLAGEVDGPIIKFASGADPALVAETKISGAPIVASYRTRDHAIVTTGMVGQNEVSAITFAAALLIRREADFAAAYGAFLDAVKEGKTPDAVLSELLATASDELAVGIESDLGLDDPNTLWYSSAKRGDGTMDEADDPAAVDLGPLFGDPKTYKAYQAGEPTDFDIVQSAGGVAATGAVINIDPNGFVGPQLDTAVRFMQTGRHILHHGPTGTGKSFVWDLAMRQIDPEFDANNYPFFVHGSAGLEDIDFTGNYVLRPNGSREWVHGPLVRAMLEGKRFKVEEMNRMPAPMLNVLLGAMDYGRISLPRYDGQVVIAQPGFAVDAMANIGREYVGTDDIDPAILRRFQIKVEYDYLPADSEIALLRSRYPDIKPQDAEVLVRIAMTVRDAYENGSGEMEVDMATSPAALLNSAALVSEGFAVLEAIELTWLADVAHTKAHRESVKATIDMHLREQRGRKRGRK